MRKSSFFFVMATSLSLLVVSPGMQAQDRTEAQSEGAGKPQANSQAQSQAVSQSQSQAQSQATSQATSQAISQQTNSQIQGDTSSQSMPGMDMRMNDANQAAMQEVPDGGQGSTDAMQSMEDHHMDMGPHMKMTALRPVQPGDQAKADEVVEAARKAAVRYADYRDALADGYHIFLPNVPQKQYHFTNNHYGLEAAYRFNPDHPTSLLYQKEGNGYKLVGVMYTARKRATEEELNQRIPLSIAQWHAHVNFCLPPFGSGQLITKNTQFGMRGSIATKEACDAAGGYFIPQVFGWMVHVYPFEKNQADIWAVERQAPSHMD
ncbi:MAG: hypothetical protein ABSE92_09485 [Terriglobales bacterium]|jgi:hypothetical protein